jgi:nitrogen-specific signal transduction histidine kinase
MKTKPLEGNLKIKEFEHELRNCLSAMASSGALLENYIKAETQPEKQLRHVRLIRQSTEDMITQLNRLFSEQ